MIEQFDMLLELQKIDNDIDEEEKKKRNLPSKVERITIEIQELKNNLTNKHEDYKELHTKLKRKELDLSDKSNKIKRHQEDLYGGKITDIKELKQLQRVIANYKKEESNIEDELLDLMEEIEDLNKSVNKLEGDLKEREEYLLKSQQEMELMASKIEESMNFLNIKRGEILSKLTDNRLLKEYRLLRKEKHGKVIVKVNSATCPGCYLDLPSDIIYQLKKSQTIITCPNCNRILVWKG